MVKRNKKGQFAKGIVRSDEYKRRYQREWRKEWRRKNREKYLKFHREYQSKWRRKNKDRLKYERNYMRNKRKNSVGVRLNDSMGSMIYKALKQNKAGLGWETLVGYTLRDLMRHLERLFTPEMSWENYGSYFVIDHIKPRSLFNIKTAEDKGFKKCWALDNLQPLEKIANIKKSNYYKK